MVLRYKIDSEYINLKIKFIISCYIFLYETNKRIFMCNDNVWTKWNLNFNTK